MAKRTRYTPEFKAEVVLEALCSEIFQAELYRQSTSHTITDLRTATISFI